MKPAVSVLLLASVSWAGTRSFVLESGTDFADGDADGVLIGPGELRAGRSASPIEIDAAAVWSALEAPDGTIYLGTGDDGRLLALRGRKAVEIARFDAVMVTALAWGDGALYAGTIPKGVIYRVERSGEWREYVRVDAEHVWALHWDEAKGILYAATGPGGKLFAIDRKGKARVHYDSEQEHLLSLAPAPRGLYVGTGGGAILYRVDESGRAFAVHDFGVDEVRALALGPGGSLFAAANGFEPRRPAPIPFKAPPSADAAGGTSPPPTPARPPRKPPSRKAKGTVYRVEADGGIEKWHSLADSYYTALHAEANGSLWAATAKDGRVFLIDESRRAYTALDFPERQVLALAFGGREPIAATGDAGAVYRIGSGPPSRPQYRSRVLDASFPARWGKVRWRADGLVLVHTRTGNTKMPGPTWSPWLPLRANRRAAGEYWGISASPAARYLQIRLSWPGGSRARVGSITAYYLPQNQRARVVSLEVDGADDDKKASGGGAKSSSGSKRRDSTLKLKWKVDNPDEDPLVYRLSYREELAVSWQPMGGPEPLEKTEFDWNTESLADGKYRVRVVASDETANPADLALKDALVSSPILVDNRMPEVRSLDVGGGSVAGRARDGYSAIRSLEYSVDGGPWRPVAPRDGLLDDLVEDFSFQLPKGLVSGPHTVAVRAKDAAGNVGVGQTAFRIR